MHTSSEQVKIVTNLADTAGTANKHLILVSVPGTFTTQRYLRVLNISHLDHDFSGVST
jgi:hypothetical protein